jgi:hypothetical protein
LVGIFSVVTLSPGAASEAAYSLTVGRSHHFR